MYTTKEALRPWFGHSDISREAGFRTELRKFKSQLVESIRKYVDPQIPVYTLVHTEDLIHLHQEDLSGRVDAIPLDNVSVPSWAGTWHKQSFSKVLVPELALQKKCSRVLFLDNDVEIRKDTTRLFNAEAPTMVIDNEGRTINSGIFLLDINKTFVDSWKNFIKQKYSNRRHTLVKGLGFQDGSDQECWGGDFGNQSIFQLPLNYNANIDRVRSETIGRDNISIAHYYPSNTRWRW